ncbi:hypothetical protein CkaCkLH20_05625 [Colletotrichum karsti]|uniref:Uncharacterized protein n=1 Tax=Colletotrichum karsti TaxID=1095194 RepID=A0A9P6LHY4_9PEZI|nr:uncharacterized protein CkaCkLH20_05625 [Colletotrichum karsti]KAF9876779.1 hypothetical protein CkaCkLH20_05625 [Colletotrichum karsti]
MSVNSAIAALPAYKALDAYVKTGDDKKALDETVQKFNDLAKDSESQLEDFLWDTYNAIFAVAKQTPPEKQGPLVDFIQRLRETTVTASDGQSLHLSEGVVWKDLPTFGWVARDLWNFDITDASASKEEKASWDNLAAFLAQLTARASVVEGTADPLDYSTYGLWALRDAFETEHPADADSAAAVRHASLWIRHAGDAFRKLSAEDRDLEAKTGAAGGRFGDRQWKGFNRERWGVWTEGFATAQSSLADEEAKGLAGRAVDIMKSK